MPSLRVPLSPAADSDLLAAPTSTATPPTRPASLLLLRALLALLWIAAAFPLAVSLAEALTEEQLPFPSAAALATLAAALSATAALLLLTAPSPRTATRRRGDDTGEGHHTVGHRLQPVGGGWLKDTLGHAMAVFGTWGRVPLTDGADQYHGFVEPSEHFNESM